MSARNFYNQCINLFWTALCFLPVLSFWLGRGTNTWLVVFLCTSLVVMFLPERMLNRLQFHKQKRFYERLGVRIIRRFVQDGDWRSRRHAYGSESRIKSRASLQAYLKTISMYERYHFGCFLFFTQTSIYGMSDNGSLWLICTWVANIVYNLCPLLLQQYNRNRTKTMLLHMR